MKNVGIICGGFSSEFDVSVKSATNIFNNFPTGYRPFLILLKKEGWFIQNQNRELGEVNSRDFTFKSGQESIKIDFAIVYIHGDPGENGKIQSYLEMIDIPYVNSGPLASQLSFDKWYCNQFLKGFGHEVADSIYITELSIELDSDQIVEQLGLPIFVKPCDSGSSFGIEKVNKVEDLEPAVQNAFNEGSTIVLESFLDGIEVTCAVYRDKDGVHTLPLTEIVSENEFFDYEAKYKGLSQEITPARISDELRAKVQYISSSIYNLMQLRSVARVDFIIVNGVPNIIEVNSIPGFSNESIVPKMLEAADISIKEFWASILTGEF
jgi:D-alanine-D-alanine ligase